MCHDCSVCFNIVLFQYVPITLWFCLPIQASDGPFAWERPQCDDGYVFEMGSHMPSDEAPHCDPPAPSRMHSKSRSPKRDPPNEWIPKQVGDDLRGLDRTLNVFRLIGQNKHMEHKLPRAGATAGRVLAHASAVFQTLLDKHKPMSFKFGITHCAHFRWYHRPYGYAHGCEKFSNMTIVYASCSPSGPAWLEAALIDKFRSCSAETSRHQRVLNLCAGNVLYCDVY